MQVTAHHTLEPGDLLLTGTPEGVGPVFPGDVIHAGITELDLQIRVPIGLRDRTGTANPEPQGSRSVQGVAEA